VFDVPATYVYTCIVRHAQKMTPTMRPALPCACANLRRAARAVSRLYNQALRPAGIEITQFTLLMALSLTGETSQGELAELLALDSTTLTRTLNSIRKKRWVHIRPGKDRRQRLVSLTSTGNEKLQQSMSHWTRAQTDLQKAVGDDTFARLGGMLAGVTAATSVS
jgi:DNA-binding MarR family transcriptional regulator